MKKYAKWIGLTLVVVLVGGGVARGLDRRPQSADADATQVTVVRGDIETTVEASGRVVPLAEATLAFDTPGAVAQVWVQEGAWVQAGAPLLRLDTAALERAVRAAEQSLVAQEASLAELRRGASAEDIAAAQAAVASAQAQLNHLLAGPRAEEIAAAQASVRVAEAGLWAASAQRDQVTAGPTAAEIAAAASQIATAQTQQKIARDTHDKTVECHTLSLPDGKQQELCPGLGAPEEQARYNLYAADAALNAAQAQLDQLQAGATPEQIDAAQANVAVAAAQRDAAQAQLDLLLAGSTQAQIAAAQAQLAQAQAALAALSAGPSGERLAIAEAQVEQARIALQDAQYRLARATLVAPFDGAITRVLAEPGEWVMAGSPVAILTDLSAVEIELTVDEVDIGQVAVGQAARVTLESWPADEIPATVTRIAPTANLETGLVTYRVYLDVLLDDSAADFAVVSPAAISEPRVIRPGMTANAEMVTQRLTDVLLAPNRAIQSDRATGRYTVERVAAGGAETVEITIGLRNANYSQVLSGVQAGDVVLIPPVEARNTQQLSLPDARRLFGGQ
jgi:HlyD family secretion protein